MMTKLNIDILYLIFQEINEDKNFLFSCLLVNKFWCKFIVPILWGNPLKYINSKREDKLNIIYNIIILHLSEESRNFLKSKNINNIPMEQQKLSFNYVSFCKYIDIIVVITRNFSQRRLLREELLKLFISECSNIISLETSSIEHSVLFSQEFFYPIYDYPGANISLSNLCELICTSDHYSLFCGLAKICRSIEKISMILTCDNNYLAELINVQNKIRYIKLIDLSKKTYRYSSSQFKNIFHSLEKQAHSILYLNLKCADSYFLFSKFVNLETLILYQFYDSEDLETAVFSKLQILELTSESLNTAINIIQNTNGNLWKVKIDVYSYETSREYIQAIYKSIEIIMYDKNFDESLNLFFNDWKNRKTLYIYNKSRYYNYEEYNFGEVVLKRDNDFWHDDYERTVWKECEYD
ncbi:hypothetical protein C1645_824974 [Glomus cerebriforme]|uniref:F-box domain-containing protein n=1 Tax=Glomus cerebriforme TaxID=658196 RepID=A0A397SZV5_9GLOM|nr:hypothetical protein C1645_824974 [Glomus cerebriforme]